MHNAKCVLSLIADAQARGKDQPEHGHFDDWIWSFVDGAPQLNEWAEASDVPAVTETSKKMSQALKSRGFKFVGPTICYSLMQSCGLVIDHPVDTPEWQNARERLGRRVSKGGPTLASSPC